MRNGVALALLLTACASAHHDPHQGDSPYAAASGVIRHDEGGAFRMVPLHVMNEDVEILYGDPEKEGEPFGIRIRELPGTIIPLHTHPVDENITIVQGTWYFAVGDHWDRSALHALKAGDYAFAAKGSTMFGWCPDGAIVQINGVGPFHIHWKNGIKTTEDADAASTFTFRKGERVTTPLGAGTIRQGYASGEVIQYEVAGDNGIAFMASQSEIAALPR
jgi:quercetin dioxygenase-like cupin family protein